MPKRGEVHAVGALLGVIASEEVDDVEIDAFIAAEAEKAKKEVGPATSTAPAAPVTAVANDRQAAPVAVSTSLAVPTQEPLAGETQVPTALKEGSDDRACRATPHARKFASEIGVNLNNVPGSGRHDRISKKDIEKAIQAAGGKVAAPQLLKRTSGPARSTADDSHLAATPVARRLAAQLGINLNDCRASGSRGRCQ